MWIDFNLKSKFQQAKKFLLLITWGRNRQPDKQRQNTAVDIMIVIVYSLCLDNDWVFD